MAQRTGKDFAISGIILGVVGLFITAKIPWDVLKEMNFGMILAVFAILLGVVAVVKKEKGLGLLAIMLGAIPFLQLVIDMAISAFGDFDWVVSIIIMVVAVLFVVWLLFIKK
jgi:hypothetical protein